MVPGSAQPSPLLRTLSVSKSLKASPMVLNILYMLMIHPFQTSPLNSNCAHNISSWVSNRRSKLKSPKPFLDSPQLPSQLREGQHSTYRYLAWSLLLPSPPPRAQETFVCPTFETHPKLTTSSDPVTTISPQKLSPHLPCFPPLAPSHKIFNTEFRVMLLKYE